MVHRSGSHGQPAGGKDENAGNARPQVGLLGPTDVTLTDPAIAMMLAEMNVGWQVQKGAVNKCTTNGAEMTRITADQTQKCKKWTDESARVERLRHRFPKWAMPLVLGFLGALSAFFMVISAGTLTPLIQMMAFTLVTSIAQSISDACKGPSLDIADLLSSATTEIFQKGFGMDADLAHQLGDFVSATVVLAMKPQLMALSPKLAGNAAGGFTGLVTHDENVRGVVKTAATIAATIIVVLVLARREDKLQQAMTQLRQLAAKGLCASSTADATIQGTKSGMNIETHDAELELEGDGKTLSEIKLWSTMWKNLSSLDLDFLKRTFKLNEAELGTIFGMAQDMLSAQKAILRPHRS